MKVRNVRGYALEIGVTGQIVGPGEVAEVDDDLGAGLLEQPDNWTKAPARPGRNKEGDS